MRRVIWLSIVIILIGAFAWFFYYRYTAPAQSVTARVVLYIYNSVILVTIVTIIYTLVRENRDPRSSLAWIQVLVFLPVVGVILYFVFGVNFRKRRLFARKMKDDEDRINRTIKPIEEAKGSLQTQINLLDHNKLSRLLFYQSNAGVAVRNQVETIFSGKEAIDRMIEEIARAKHHIHIEMFSIVWDSIGKRVLKLLQDKAAEGVQVRVVYDAVGSWTLWSWRVRKLKRAGIEIVPFFPVRLRVFAHRVNYRNHRKIVIIDGKLAFLGGVNLGDKYYDLDRYFGHWRDTVIVARGDLVYALQKVFLLDWFFASGKRFKLDKYFPAHTVEEHMDIQNVTSGPDTPWENILQAYFMLITGAEHFIWITTPYLIIDESLLTALCTASLSGVDVRIVVPGKPEHWIVWFGNRSYFDQLMSAGVRIFLYMGGYTHAKVVLTDDRIASVGTANFDMRSLRLNFEINSIVYDEDFAKGIRKQFETDFEHSNELGPEKFQQRNVLHKLAESASKLLSPLL